MCTNDLVIFTPYAELQQFIKICSPHSTANIKRLYFIPKKGKEICLSIILNCTSVSFLVKCSLFTAFCTLIYAVHLWCDYRKHSFGRLIVACNEAMKLLLRSLGGQVPVNCFFQWVFLHMSLF